MKKWEIYQLRFSSVITEKLHQAVINCELCEIGNKEVMIQKVIVAPLVVVVVINEKQIVLWKLNFHPTCCLCILCKSLSANFDEKLFMHILCPTGRLPGRKDGCL